MEAIVFVSTPPLSFDILTSAWAQRVATGERGREREDYRKREKHRERERDLKGRGHRTWLEGKKMEA